MYWLIGICVVGGLCLFAFAAEEEEYTTPQSYTNVPAKIVIDWDRPILIHANGWNMSVCLQDASGKCVPYCQSGEEGGCSVEVNFTHAELVAVLNGMGENGVLFVRTLKQATLKAAKTKLP
jgi:hypothetical protein